MTQKYESDYKFVDGKTEASAVKAATLNARVEDIDTRLHTGEEHQAGAAQHREIDDGATSSIDLLSAEKIIAAYAPIAKGVTGGDSHDHEGGDGNQIDHVDLANKGTNTHAEIDTHVDGTGSDHANVATNTAHGALTDNPHSVTPAQAGPTVEEADGAPSVALVSKIIVPDGWLDDEGSNVVKLDPFDFSEGAWGHDGFWGGALANRWVTANSGAGSSVSFGTTSYPGFYRLNCGTVLLGHAYLSLTNAGGTIKNFDPDKGVKLRFRIASNGALPAAQAIGAGFSTSFLVDTEWALFTAAQNGNSGLWVCQSGNAAGTETTNTILSCTTWRTLEIIATGASIKFYIGGALQATHTTRLVHDPSILTMYTIQGGDPGTAVNMLIDDVFWQAGK